MKYHIQESYKFACISFTYMKYDHQKLSTPIDLGDGQWVLFEPPVDVNEQWRDSLGSLLSDDIAKSDFWLLAESPSTKPDILDDENEKLSMKVNSLYGNLLLIGSLGYESAYALTGANNRGFVKIHQIDELEEYRPSPGDAGIMIDKIVLEQAASLSLSSESINAANNSYERLRRGFNALHRAWKESQGAEYRIHQYVRSLEALVKPDIGKTKRQFICRCQTFAKKDNIAKQVLEESYDIRSQIEHLHGWKAALKSYPSADVERIAELRLRQIEALARDAYICIVESDDLKNIFIDDTSIEKFWREPEDVRSKRWGPGMDLGLVV